MYTEFLDIMNLVFTAVFAFEFVVKFAAFGLREYVKDPWNNFDFVIVIASNPLCAIGLLYSHLKGFCKVELRLLFSVNDLILLLEDYN